MIKEIVVGPEGFTCAAAEHGLFGAYDDCLVPVLGIQAKRYSIPSEQDTVNEMVENAGSLMESFVRDTQQ